MTSTTSRLLKETILKLLLKKTVINISELAHESGLSMHDLANRRAMQRALAQLIKEGYIQAQGRARARIYRLHPPVHDKTPPITAALETPFQHLSLSQHSIIVLRYLSQPVQARKPVGYEQDFLRSYVPNQTYYLKEDVRKHLQNLGAVDSTICPGGTYARTIFNRLLIDLSWNSSRLEGNTYSLLETKRLIEIGESARGKSAIESLMILNHKEAIEYIIDAAHEDTISYHDIVSIHALLSNHLLGDPGASGRLRNIAVGISGSTYLPLNNPLIIRECFERLIKTMNQIKDPFEQSFFSLVHLSYLQAFVDINKRTARLVANIPLMKHNLKPLSFVDVNKEDYVLALLGVYEKNDISLLQDLYVWAYDRSTQAYTAIQQALGEPDMFKIKHRTFIEELVRTIILTLVPGSEVVATIKQTIASLDLSEPESSRLFQLIETEIISLHDGNIARFKIRPSEFQQWKNVQ